MFSEAAIYRRTVKGDGEVQDKTHQLTQAERLILILVDGAIPYRRLGQKLKGLAQGRLDRALLSLLKRNLIVEVEGSPTRAPFEKLDPLMVDRFLRQDPLEPITITLLAQTDEGIIADGACGSGGVRSSSAIDAAERHGLASVDFYLPLERVTHADGPPIKPNPVGAGRLHTASSRDQGRRRGDSAARRRREARSRRVQVGYWLLFIGLIAAMLSVIVQSG